MRKTKKVVKKKIAVFLKTISANGSKKGAELINYYF